MPEINVLPQALDAGLAPAEPGPLTATPGALAVRELAALMKAPLRGAIPGAALRVSVSDVQAFDAALAAADGAPSDAGGADAAAGSSVAFGGPPGSMGEMTAALGVYRSANPAPTPQTGPGDPGPATVHAAGSPAPSSEPNPLEATAPMMRTPAAEPAHPGPVTALPTHQAQDLGGDAMRPDVPAVGRPVSLTPAAALASARLRPAPTADGDDARAPEAATLAGPAAPLDATVPVAPAASVQAAVPTVASPAVSVAREGAALGRMDVATIVQQVTRTLALRDLQALDAGREVVLRLDEALLPQTVLTFKPEAALAAGGPAGAPQVTVSLETRSDDVRTFLDTHGQALIDAMSQEAPGLRWVRGAANSWLDRAAAAVPADSALASAAATAGDPTQAAIAASAASASAFQGGASRDRDDASAFQGEGGGSGSQERGSPSGQGQGRGEDRSPFAAPAPDEAARARAQAADRWSGQSESARQQATQAFTDAVDGRT